MRKWHIVIMVLLIPLVILIGCFLFILALDFFMSKDKVIDSLGRFESEFFVTGGGFSEYTDYAKYTYDDADLEGNRYFEKITPESKKTLVAYISNFKSWVAMYEENNPENELAVGYDFDYRAISDNDYLYIDSDFVDVAYERYDVYFFDAETMTLYYFHNNI